MDTADLTVTDSWTQVAADSDDPVLIQRTGFGEWFAAVTAADEAPSGVTGHPVAERNQVISRDHFPSGYIWARCSSGSDTFSVSK